MFCSPIPGFFPHLCFGGEVRWRREGSGGRGDITCLERRGVDVVWMGVVWDGGVFVSRGAPDGFTGWRKGRRDGLASWRER